MEPTERRVVPARPVHLSTQRNQNSSTSGARASRIFRFSIPFAAIVCAATTVATFRYDIHQ